MPQSSQALAEFEQEYFFPSDIPNFLKTYNLPMQNVTNIVGPNNPEEGKFSSFCLLFSD